MLERYGEFGGGGQFAWYKNWCIYFMQYDTVEKAVKSAVKKFGKIDILVNCKSFLCIMYIFMSIVYFSGHFVAAAGNFLCPASALSSNAFRTGIYV